jgi:hypothetical protein
MKERRAIIVYFDPAHRDDPPQLVELNRLLNSGWLPVNVAGMGGAGAGASPSPGQVELRQAFAALVILERESDRAVTGFTAP